MQILRKEGKKTWVEKVKTFGSFDYYLKEKIDWSAGSTEKFNLYSSLAKEIVQKGQSTTTQNTFDNLKEKGAIKAEGKDILQILIQQGLKLKDGEHIIVYMKPVKNSSVGAPRIFYADRDGDTLKLLMGYADPGRVWDGGHRFVFSISK